MFLEEARLSEFLRKGLESLIFCSSFNILVKLVFEFEGVFEGVMVYELGYELLSRSLC